LKGPGMRCAHRAAASSAPQRRSVAADAEAVRRPERPPWMVRRVPSSAALDSMRVLFEQSCLHTVCESASCPNRGECFSRGTATFLLLGDVCTRRCTFCAVNKGTPLDPDELEPASVARVVARLGLRHVVLTSVTRDDLGDGGAAHFAQTVSDIREVSPGATVEVLVPDFGGSASSIATVLKSRPEVVNHNIETVPELYAEVRPAAMYERSLQLLRQVSSEGRVIAKSGIMLGMGEERREVVAVMHDLLSAGCRFLTVGQYLPPTARHYPVRRYLEQEEYDEYADIGREMGFAAIVAGPFVRSSYMAAEMLASRA
jgi:lipoic acid synthetase